VPPNWCIQPKLLEYSVLRTINEKQVERCENRPGKYEGVRIPWEGIQSHSILERIERDEKPFGWTWRSCRHVQGNAHATNKKSKGASILQPIRRIGVRFPSNQSQHSEGKPWNSQSEMIPDWWHQLMSLLTNQRRTPLSGQSANTACQGQLMAKRQNTRESVSSPLGRHF